MNLYAAAAARSSVSIPASEREKISIQVYGFDNQTLEFQGAFKAEKSSAAVIIVRLALCFAVQELSSSL